MADLRFQLPAARPTTDSGGGRNGSDEHGAGGRHRTRGSSVGQHEVESHVPSLKAQGKSDCAVRIIKMSDCETDIAIDSLSIFDASWRTDGMREALAQARSPAGSVRSGALAFAGSRTAQAQKARRRPVFQQRQSSPGLRTPRSRPRSRHSADLSAAAPMPSYIASSTMRKLTSARWAVRKEAFTGARQDGSRLLKQIQKQLLFSAQCRTGGSVNDAVSTPEVYGLASTQHDAAAAASRLSVDMEYIPFNDVRHVMLEKDRATNEWLVTTAIGLIDGNLALSTAVPLSDHWPAFQQKADSIKQAVAKSALLSADERLAAVAQINHLLDHYSLPAAQRAMIPLGPCHGDLTLTNMLVDTENRELCVFDFLDCFVDIAKLLQDVRHYWYLTQVPVPVNQRGRAVAVLGYFHERLRAAYVDYAFWDVIPLFEFFCLARILPYMSEESEKRCVLSGMARVHDSLFSSPASSPTGPEAITVPADLDESYDMTSKTVTVIVPALGQDMEAMFPSGEVKLLTVNKSNRPIIVDCIAGLSCENIGRIIVAVRTQLVESLCETTDQFEQLFHSLGPDMTSRLEFFYHPAPTADAVETVELTIAAKQVTGPIFIKDGDNDFTHRVVAGNYVTVRSIVAPPGAASSASAASTSNGGGGSAAAGSFAAPPVTRFTPPAFRLIRPDLVDVMHKSFITFAFDNVVSNLAYGSVLSSSFCTGGWAFLRADDFSSAAATLRALLKTSGLAPAPAPTRTTPARAPMAFSATSQSNARQGLRVVDIVWQMLCEGHLFFGLPVDAYRDWGSGQAWLAASIDSGW